MASPIPLIHPPSKSTLDIDLAPPLRHTIASAFSENPDTYADEISALNRCRQDALRGGASGTTARDLLYRYFGQLELLELRFPDLRVPFPWNDAFTNKHISQMSLAYEKASVIFNIAACLAHLGATQNRTSAQGLKRAFNFFRSASGMFSYIQDNFLHAPSADLGPEVVSALVLLMNAQATEMFYETMVDERKSASLKARVCSQAANLYSSLTENVREIANRSIFDRTWNYVVQAKAKYYNSLAQYNRSLADTAASKYGDAIARLQIAETTATEAHRLAQTFSTLFNPASCPTLPSDAPSTFTTLLKGHLSLVTEAKTAAVKDNDYVYNDIVPLEAALAVIEKTVVADPITIQKVYSTPEVQEIVGQDIFSRLVPLAVHESASMYSEEKAKLVRAEGEHCDIADNELASSLEHLGLPASLSKFRNSSSTNSLQELADPGPQVMSWAQAISDQESQDPVQQLFNQLESLRSNNSKTLQELSRELDVETYECEQARVKFGHIFTQEPSSSGSKTFRSDIKSHKEALEKAEAADSQAQNLWNSIRDDVALLTKNDDGEALSTLFATGITAESETAPTNLIDTDISDDGLAQLQKSVSIIDDALSRLNKIKSERKELFKDLKDKIQSDDISQLLILNRKNASIEPSIFASELEKFRPHQGKIGATLHYQQLALSEISNHYSNLVNSKKGKDIQTKWSRVERKRRELITRFSKVNSNYSEVRKLLGMGLQFYKDLNGLVNPLSEDVKTFISKRNTERSRLVNDAEVNRRLNSSGGTDNTSSSREIGLESSMSSMQINSTSQAQSQPPPLPPAPHRSASSSSYQVAPPQSPPYQQQPVAHSPYPNSPQPQQMHSYSSPQPQPHLQQHQPMPHRPPQSTVIPNFPPPPQPFQPQSSLPPPSQPFHPQTSLPPPSQPFQPQTTLAGPPPVQNYNMSYGQPQRQVPPPPSNTTSFDQFDPYAPRAVPPPPSTAPPHSSFSPQYNSYPQQPQSQPQPQQQQQQQPMQPYPPPPPPPQQHNWGQYQMPPR